MVKKKTVVPLERGYHIDSIRSGMPAEDLAEWDELCSFRPKITDLERWLNQRGYQATYSQVYYWFKVHYTPGSKALKIATSAAEYSGLDARVVAGMAMAASARILVDFLGVFDSAALKDAIADDPKIVAQILPMIPAILRECRAASQNYHQMEAPANQKDNVLSGAYAMAEELKLVFKDTAFESALVDAITSGLLRIEGN
jgi:hypothetical protein